MTTQVETQKSIRIEPRDVAMVLAGVTLTFLAAQIAIPTQPVPITMQTLAVMVAGFALGPVRGAMSQAVYVALGLAGLPVFQGFQGGAQLMTLGYLLGFVALAFVCGKAAAGSATKRILAAMVGSAVVLGLGTLWLGAWVSLEKAYVSGFLPFIAIELGKAVLAAFTPAFGRSRP